MRGYTLTLTTGVALVAVLLSGAIPAATAQDATDTDMTESTEIESNNLLTQGMSNDTEPGPLEPADDVNILLPDRFNVNTPGLFERGNIIPIELELSGGNAATVTFGDLVNTDIEIHATLYDPTYDTEDVENNADTTVRAYLNTYQTGHGYVRNRTADEFQPHRPDWISTGDWENRRHGFFTHPADNGSALVSASRLDREHNVYASIDPDADSAVYGGSQGGAVLSAGGLTSDGEIVGLRRDVTVTGNTVPYTLVGESRGDGLDDINAVDLVQSTSNSLEFWTASRDSANELQIGESNDTTIDDIRTLESEGILRKLETESDDGARRVTENLTEGDYLIIRTNTSGLTGVLHEATVRDQNRSAGAFLDRSENHLVTDAITTAATRQLPRLDEPLLNYTLRLVEGQAAYQQRLGEKAAQAVNQSNPVETTLRLADADGVVAGMNGREQLSEYWILYRLGPELLGVDLPLSSADNITFGATAVFEPNGGSQPGSGETHPPLAFRNPSPVEFTNLTVGPPRVGTVSGTVTDSDGEGVSGVQVSLVQGEFVTETTTTSTDGEFVVEVEPGSYDITVEEPGFEPFVDTISVELYEQSQLDIGLNSSDDSDGGGDSSDDGTDDSDGGGDSSDDGTDDSDGGGDGSDDGTDDSDGGGDGSDDGTDDSDGGGDGSDDRTDENSDDGSGPGFGVLGVVTALAGIGYLLKQRMPVERT
jgi:hypothetical protein